MRFFAFVRAINTGNRRLTNEALLAPLRERSCTDVAAYQAAGNLTFRTADPELADPLRLAEVLGAAYGFDAPVFVRTADELGAIVAARPFSEAALARTARRIQVGFMHSRPEPAAIDRVRALVPPDDRVEFVGRELFWLPVDGVSGSALPVSTIETDIGPMTIRTLGTVERMLARFAG